MKLPLHRVARITHKLLRITLAVSIALYLYIVLLFGFHFFFLDPVGAVP